MSAEAQRLKKQDFLLFKAARRRFRHRAAEHFPLR
jgi:hypothetical protein